MGSASGTNTLVVSAFIGPAGARRHIVQFMYI